MSHALDVAIALYLLGATNMVLFAYPGNPRWATLATAIAWPLVPVMVLLGVVHGPGCDCEGHDDAA